jgi:biotin synthase
MSIQDILSKDTLSREDIIRLLSAETPEEIELIRSKAYNTMLEYVGDKVYLRGLIEFSNYCVNDCYYCGIRKSNANTERYLLSVEQVIEAAKLAAEFDYGSVVLQSGDRRDEQFIEYVVSCIKGIKDATKSEKYPEGLGITLCVGEQTEETYRRFFEEVLIDTY